MTAVDAVEGADRDDPLARGVLGSIAGGEGGRCPRGMRRQTKERGAPVVLLPRVRPPPSAQRPRKQPCAVAAGAVGRGLAGAEPLASGVIDPDGA